MRSFILGRDSQRPEYIPYSKAQVEDHLRFHHPRRRSTQTRAGNADRLHARYVREMGERHTLNIHTRVAATHRQAIYKDEILSIRRVFAKHGKRYDFNDIDIKFCRWRRCLFHDRVTDQQRHRPPCSKGMKNHHAGAQEARNSAMSNGTIESRKFRVLTAEVVKYFISTESENQGYIRSPDLPEINT